MAVWLAYIKQVVRDILGELQRNYQHIRVRMAFLGYTDYDDRGVATYYRVDFNDPAQVTPQLESIQALASMHGVCSSNGRMCEAELMNPRRGV